MTPLLQAVDDALSALGVSEARAFVDANEPSLVIAAKDPTVGDLAIYDENEELTVCFGQLHHTHFTPRWNDGSPDQRAGRAATEAAGYVADILQDKMKFTVKYRGDDCISSSSEYIEPDIGPSDSICYPLNGLFFRSVRVETYIWSGRLT